MGGYTAFILGGLYKIPVLAFNPALHSRTIEPNFPEFVKHHIPDEFTVVIGDEDTLIDGQRTLNYLKDHIRDTFVKWEVEHIKKMGHRIPLNVFSDMYNKTIK